MKWTFNNTHKVMLNKWSVLMLVQRTVKCSKTDKQMDIADIVLDQVKPSFNGHLNIPEEVSLYDRSPFITGNVTWGRYDTVLRK